MPRRPEPAPGTVRRAVQALLAAPRALVPGMLLGGLPLLAGLVPVAAAPRLAWAAEAADVRAREIEDGGNRTALRRAVDQALPAVVRRAQAPQASAATRRAARSLALLGEALERPEPSLAAEVATRFSTRPAQPVFVTGYHEPLLEARRRRDGRFRYPLYRPPPRSAAKAGRLPTRADIDAGALDDMGLEIFWTDDPVELFFLHVQGSGRLRLGDGSIVRLAYAANNGHPYRAIGKVLVERGVFRPEEATAPALKRYLRDHPGEMWGILRQNTRYVFFAERGEDEPSAASSARLGPVGALNVPLVPYRSVAVDPKAVELGSVGFLRVPLPGGRELQSLVVAMDTGAAITGPGRIDLFCGPGAEAARVAGELRHRGEVVWLEPRR